jgi:hypothetical protein
MNEKLENGLRKLFAVFACRDVHNVRITNILW